MFLSETEQLERKNHNKNIANVPELIGRGVLPGEYLLVRLFAHEGDVSNEDGILVPRYKQYESEGGLPKASVDNAKYTTRGVVLKVGTGVESRNFQIGDIVYVPIHASIDNSRYFFNLNREKVVSDFEGIIRLPVNLVEFNTRDNLHSDRTINDVYASSTEQEPETEG